MTVKQVLIGSLVGLGALGLMFHRLPRFSVAGLKTADKNRVKAVSRINSRAPQRQSMDDRVSASRHVG